jgi:hypothetical protein
MVFKAHDSNAKMGLNTEHPQRHNVSKCLPSHQKQILVGFKALLKVRLLLSGQDLEAR